MAYYHGSNHKFNIGDGIWPVNEYTSADNIKDLEALFEEERPEKCAFPRIDCVFLTTSVQDLDSVGAHDDYTYEVDIEDGFTESSDLAWYSKAAGQLEQGDIEGARESARKYWSGERFEIPSHSVFEHRTDECYIIEIL